MAIETLYKGRIPCFNYLFANGKPAIFMDSKFSTGIQDEIDQLNKEVANNHPYIYIDAEELTIDTVKQDPMNELRERFRQELLAEQAAISTSTADMGTSITPEKLVGIATTAKLGALSAGSTSGGTMIPAG
jgi:hypothetical protein